MRMRNPLRFLLLLAVGGTLLQLGGCAAYTAQLFLGQFATAFLGAIAGQFLDQFASQIAGSGG